MDVLAISFETWLASLGSGDVLLDTVVIGSGYGGSVAALRMAQQGCAVVMLERGSEYLPGEFPNDAGQLPKHLRAQLQRGVVGRASGLFDWHVGPAVASLVANGLGGGSLVNAGVMMRPRREVFSQAAWPGVLRLRSDLRALRLQRGFARARRELKPQRFRFNNRPGDDIANLPKAQALKRTGQALAADPEVGRAPVRIAPALVTIDLAKCTQCGDCFTGCNVPGAKRTLRDTYLQKARQAGAVMVTGAQVWSITPRQDTRDWELRCIATQRSTHRATLPDAVALDGVTLRARRVVVAAGTFGSTELLQRSRALAGEGVFSLSPALGTRFSTNGDSLSAAADEPLAVNALGHGADTAGKVVPVGPTITTVLDLRARPALREQLVIQEGAVPGALVRVFQEGLALAWTLHHLGAAARQPRHVTGPEGGDPLAAPLALAQHSQLLLTMGHDDASGRIVWVGDMDASVPFWSHPEDATTYRWQARVLEATERTGARHLQSPLWRLLPESALDALSGPKPQPVALTVHPLGGCPMGDSFETGVVDDVGRVWRGPGERWEGLWVLDGSIVPTALGCNPLWTITALAERAMAHWAYEWQKVASDAAASLAQARALLAAAPRPVPRVPAPLVRAGAPTFAVRLSERLERDELMLRGALRGALPGAEAVEADLTVRMRTPDWDALWQGARHVITDVRGRLRLVETQRENPQRVVYEIRRGEVSLLARSACWPGFETLCGTGGFLRALFTWWWTRACRDAAAERRQAEAPSLWSYLKRVVPMARILWQAGEVRRVRYRLELHRVHPGRAAAQAPERLVLLADKRISYAATCGELLAFGARWIGRRVRGLPPPCPTDLRLTYVDQLTRPMVRLVTAGPLARWRAYLPWGVTQARFDFDMQGVLQRSPVTLLGGGDSSTAMLSLAAYPLLVLRHALQTRVLDFRLPDYSGRPVADDWRTERLHLRKKPAGAAHDVVPTLHVLQVRRGLSSSDDGTEDGSLITLPLWRYARPEGQPGVVRGTWHGVPVRRVRSVLLMHAFAMSGSTFTLKTIDCNLAEYLYEKGYEVWVLDTRMSPRVAGSSRPGTLDQAGLIDAPAAVDHVLGVLGQQDALGAGPPLQIFSFAHCLGAGAMLMALLAGRLHHGVQPAGSGPTGPWLPKLAGLACSQVHPFMVGSRRSQAKTWIAAFVRDVSARTAIPLAVRNAAPNLLEAFVDRLFASLPVPKGERCPDEGLVRRLHDDDCATCRRIRFFDGDLFQHARLNAETHAALPRLFGDGAVRLFAHGARIVEHERLVTEDGLNAYATDEAMARHLGLPMRFVHGRKNDLFDKESAIRSADQFKRLQPEWSAQFAVPGGATQTADLIDDYGHVDLLIGKTASTDTYGRLVGLFDQVMQAAADQPAPAPPNEVELQVRFPRLGPWLGPVRTTPQGRCVDVAFVLDDMRAESSPDAQAGQLEATAIVHGAGSGLGAPVSFELDVRCVRASLVARDGFRVGGRGREALENSGLAPSMVRVAHGTVPLPAGAEKIVIELVSHAEAPRGSIQPRGGGLVRGAGMPLVGSLSPADADRLATLFAGGFTRLGLREKIDQAAADATRTRRDASRPFPANPSQLLQRPISPRRRFATLHRHVLAEPGPDDAVRMALGCCRYPGFPFDRERSDAVFNRLLSLQRGPLASRVQLGVMLGDQIYADATAGYVDPLSAVERYSERHLRAFDTPALQRLMAQLPWVLAPDDHEYGDDYPRGAPLFGGTARNRDEARVRNEWRRRVAFNAMTAFQQSAFPLAKGVGQFELGDVRCLVLDTRSARTATRGPFDTLSASQMVAIADWLAAGARTQQFHVVCTGSVVWPRLVPLGDPANAGPPDTWQDAVIQRRWLLEQLVARVPGRFALVSGDYHVSFAGLLAHHGQAVGACIVAPPFYAPLPYANAAPHELDLEEVLPLAGGALQLTSHSAGLRGSGYGVLSVVRRDGKWSVGFEADRLDMEIGAGWTGLQPVAQWTLA